MISGQLIDVYFELPLDYFYDLCYILKIDLTLLPHFFEF